MTQVAIACQGGGAESAFAAGALPVLLRAGDVDPVAFTGTSGGAICALLAWYGLRTGGPERAAELLAGFWADNAARTPLDYLSTVSGVALLRLRDAGVLPLPTFDPYFAPQFARARLAQLLTRWVDFDRVATLSRETGPVLQVGSVEVLSGGFQRFDSRRGEITLDTVLASAAIPTLFRAVRVGAGVYWDGVFSENPPVRDLPDLGAEAIWIVQIFPRTRATEPRTPGAIADRRAELTANLSLEQELDAIDRVNRWLADGQLVGTDHRHVDVARIELDRDLDSAAASDRRPAFLEGLQADGERTAEAFLAGRRA